MEQDIPNYDMDSEDEAWVNAQVKTLDITPLKVTYFTLIFILVS